MKVIVWLIAGWVWIHAPSTLAQEISDEKRELIDQLLQTTGAFALGDQIMDELFELQKSQNSHIPEDTWDRVREQLDMQELKPAIHHIYDKYFSASELKELNAFYDSALGAKMIRVQPQILADSMNAGRVWAMSLQDRIRAILKNKGYSGDT